MAYLTMINELTQVEGLFKVSLIIKVVPVQFVKFLFQHPLTSLGLSEQAFVCP